jgi:asparagine synthase (glutamine-hydrolysing)
VSRDPEPAGWVGFCLFGSVPEPYTTYQEIRALPAGATLWVDRIGPGEPKPYFSIPAIYRQAECEMSPAADRLHAVREALVDSVRHHLVADVPVGAFLSAGVDSGALVGLMRDCGQSDVQTVTLAFEEFLDRSENEAPMAAEVATQYATRHTTRVVTEREFRDDVPKIFAAMDQPTIDGINTWFVSKAARELGLKVAISGLGGDELFGGYPSFRDVPRWKRLLGIPSRIPLLGEFARRILVGLRAASPKAAGMLKYGGTYAGAYLLRRGLFMPWELGTLLGEEMARAGLTRLMPLRHIDNMLDPQPHSAVGKVAVLEASLYMRNQLLRDTDWASMAHSLEVRVPLVDSILLRNVAGVIALGRCEGKMVLADAPRLPLPAKVRLRPKTGFGTPVHLWLERDKRLQRWRDVPELAAPNCLWARRWAYQLMAA